MKLKCTSCDAEFIVTAETYTGDICCPNCNSKDYVAANRSGMFFEIMRLLEDAKWSDKKPYVILAENVQAVKPLLPIIESEYKKCGYKAYFIMYNSKYWNIPQSRKRYFIVGIRNDLKREFVFPEEQHSYIPLLSSVLDENVDEKYFIEDYKAQEVIKEALDRLEEIEKVHAIITPNRINKRQNGRRAKENEENMFTLTTEDIHGVIINKNGVESKTLQDENIKTFSKNLIKFVEKNGYIPKGFNPYNSSDVSDLAPTLTTQCGTTSSSGSVLLFVNKDTNIPINIYLPTMKQVGKLNIKGKDQIKRVYSTEGISPTLTACSGGQQQVKIIDLDKCRVRKLTPTEYGRLQGFNMDIWKQVVSDSQAYKQFGNAVTVTVAKAIAESISEYLDIVLNGGNYNNSPFREEQLSLFTKEAG